MGNTEASADKAAVAQQTEQPQVPVQPAPQPQMDAPQMQANPQMAQPQMQANPQMAQPQMQQPYMMPAPNMAVPTGTVPDIQSRDKSFITAGKY